MGFFKNLFSKADENEISMLEAVSHAVAPKLVEFPKGRQSIPMEEYSNSLRSNFLVLNPKVPFTFTQYLEYYSVVNPDVSQAARNVIQLGNSGHYVDVATKGSRAAKNAIEIVKETAARVYTTGAGADGLVNALLRQQIVSGALSSEMIPAKRLRDGIQEVVLVPVSTIRWVRKDKDTLTPYQYIGDMTSTYMRAPANTVEGSYIPLNQNTYCYFAPEIMEDCPYGIPPLSAVLSVITIQTDMLKNIAGVVKKMGLVGFLSILIRAPQPKKGESSASYSSRLQTYLDDASTNFTKNFSEGIFVGFKGQHEFEHKDIGGDFRGVPELIQTIEEQICSALNQDAFMLGRVYSSTESYAGVVYDKMLQTVGTYRRLVKRFLEKVYKTDLELRGIPVEQVTVTFKPQRPLNELQTEQAKEKKIANVFSLVKSGMISWDEGARMLGFDAPYEKEPTFQPAPGEQQQPAEDEEKPDEEKSKEEDPKKKGTKPSPEEDEEKDEEKNMEGLYVATTDESYDYSELRAIR